MNLKNWSRVAQLVMARMDTKDKSGINGFGTENIRCDSITNGERGRQIITLP